MPFNFLAKKPQLCDRVQFIDVDYVKLLRHKCEVLKKRDGLSSLLADVHEGPEVDNVLLRSEHYTAISADLQSAKDLKTLKQALQTGEAPILFLAEVSMTYMDAAGASRLIEWASTFPKCRVIANLQIDASS